MLSENARNCHFDLTNMWKHSQIEQDMWKHELENVATILGTVPVEARHECF